MVQSYSQIDWVLVVFKLCLVPGHVKLPFSLTVLEVEAADLSLRRVWAQVFFFSFRYYVDISWRPCSRVDSTSVKVRFFVAKARSSA